MSLSAMRFTLTIAIAALFTWPAVAGEIYITNFTKTNNMQTALRSAYPTGLFTASTAFGTTFDITSDGSGRNFLEQFAGTPSITGLSLYGLNTVSMLANAYPPTGGRSRRWNS